MPFDNVTNFSLKMAIHIDSWQYLIKIYQDANSQVPFHITQLLLINIVDPNVSLGTMCLLLVN